MASISLWFLLGTVGMALGTLALLGGLVILPPGRRRAFGLLVAVPAIAFVAYLLMALGLGGLVGARGNTVYLPRYVDWLLTTPIHVLFVGLLAGAPRRVVGRTITLQAATIVLGLLGGLAPAPFNWGLWLVGSAAFAVVIYDVFGPIAAAARERADWVTDAFRQLRSFMIVLWLVYPFIWLVAETGIGVMDTETTALVISYIDVVAKVGFGLIALNAYLRVASDTDAAVGTDGSVGDGGQSPAPSSS